MKPSEMPTWMLEYFAPMHTMTQEREELCKRRQVERIKNCRHAITRIDDSTGHEYCCECLSIITPYDKVKEFTKCQK